jgi:hypothetical protein
MPPAIDASIKRRVIQQWINGFPRDKIAADNNIGAGTVTSIVNNYKVGLENLDFDSVRELAVEARKQGLTLSDLSSHFRLYNYFIKSGVTEEEVESFITKVSTSDIPPKMVIEYVNQLHEISKYECLPLGDVPSYIGKRLEEKRKIDEEIKEADITLQSKNVTIETMNEHIKLNELNKHGLSIHDIDKLLNLLVNVKENGFDSKKIVRKLRSIKRLENKENRLKNSCDILSKQLAKHKETLPLAELIENMHIGRSELISFKIAVNEAAETYGFPRSTAAFHVINNIRDYNKRGRLKMELSALNFQKYAINEFCSRHSDAIMGLVKLQSYGVTEDQILLHANGLLEKKSR